MSLRRALTEDERATLAELNADVDRAISARRDWMDAKMAEISYLQPGDDIYDVESGRKLGVIRKIYRSQRDNHDGIYDRSISCNYEYEHAPRCFRNTSSQLGVYFGTREDALAHADQRAAALRLGL